MSENATIAIDMKFEVLHKKALYYVTLKCLFFFAFNSQRIPISPYMCIKRKIFCNKMKIKCLILLVDVIFIHYATDYGYSLPI